MLTFYAGPSLRPPMGTARRAGAALVPVRFDARFFEGGRMVVFKQDVAIPLNSLNQTNCSFMEYWSGTADNRDGQGKQDEFTDRGAERSGKTLPPASPQSPRFQFHPQTIEPQGLMMCADHEHTSGKTRVEHLSIVLIAPALV
ncbi:hypothetical protein BaRGS_00023376 [Batillaria attramentaria]|uniref:Uncharacterized protein n=1 Tax=Batillaria attramentaria TaxID=370345 RepID=A0ABD0KE92_9CAEN